MKAMTATAMAMAMAAALGGGRCVFRARRKGDMMAMAASAS